MRQFEELDYYELLNLSPDATATEIEDAFREVEQTYRRGSLAVYSVLTEQERERMLARIREAHAILTDEVRRMKYDRSLERGNAAVRAALKDTPEAGPGSRETGASFWSRFRQVLPPQRSVGSTVSKILRGRLNSPGGELPISSGQYLESVRKLRGISLEEISSSTKIKLRYLKALEEEQYESLPKGAYRRYILKALAMAIDLDPDAVAEDFRRRTKE